METTEKARNGTRAMMMFWHFHFAIVGPRLGVLENPS